MSTCHSTVAVALFSGWIMVGWLCAYKSLSAKSPRAAYSAAAATATSLRCPHPPIYQESAESTELFNQFVGAFAQISSTTGRAEGNAATLSLSRALAGAPATTVLTLPPPPAAQQQLQQQQSPPHSPSPASPAVVRQVPASPSGDARGQAAAGPGAALAEEGAGGTAGVADRGGGGGADGRAPVNATSHAPVDGEGAAPPESTDGVVPSAGCAASSIPPHHLPAPVAATACIVCLDAPPTIGFRHGYSVHKCVCYACAQTVLEKGGGGEVHCPMCRAVVQDILLVY